MPSRFNSKLILVISAIALVVSCCAGISFGSTSIGFNDLLNNSESRLILLKLRLPRVLFAAVVGGSLAMIGATYQTLFRNQLASPFTLGVSSGAALGAAISFAISNSPISVSASAMIGALLSISLIYLISRRIGSGRGDALLLAGVVFSFFCSGLLTIVQYVSDYSQLFRATRWMMGGVPTATLVDVAITAALASVLMGWVLINASKFDLMLFGDDFATTKGVRVDSLTYTTFILSSVLVGWIVAQCGVIGFVGIVVPAGVRLLVGLRHRNVVPLSFTLGGLLVVVCDLLGRIVHPPFEVPAGVFTAIIGGPIFIGLALMRRSG